MKWNKNIYVTIAFKTDRMKCKVNSLEDSLLIQLGASERRNLGFLVKGHHWSNFATIWSCTWSISVFKIVVRIKSIGPLTIPKTAKILQVSLLMDLLPWKLCGKKGHPQGPEMRCGHRNPPLNNMPKRLTSRGDNVFDSVKFIRDHDNVCRFLHGACIKPTDVLLGQLL